MMAGSKHRKKTVLPAAENPFEAYQKSKKLVTTGTKGRVSSKFINKRSNDFLPTSSGTRREKRLQLYDLNEPLDITHKSAAIDENYEDAIPDDSEDEHDLNIDFSNRSQLLEPYQEKKLERQKLNREQQSLLEKIDAEFNDIDYRQLFKSTTASKNETPPISKPQDKFEANLRVIKGIPKQLNSGQVLFNKFKAEEAINKKCSIASEIISSNVAITIPAATCIDELVCAIEGIFKGDSNDSPLLGRNVDSIVSFALYLCSKSHREYSAFFYDFLTICKDEKEDINIKNVITLFLMLKVTSLDSSLYSGGLMLLEHWMSIRRVYDLMIARALLTIAYGAILESGCFMPKFYSFGASVCLNIVDDSPNVALACVNMFKTSMEVLEQHQCHLYPVCIHMLLPLIEKLPNSDKFTEFKAYVKELIQKPLKLYYLDIYQRPKVEAQVPLLKQTTRKNKFEPKKSLAKASKETYKKLKRELASDSYANAAAQRRELDKKRNASQARIKRVLRDAMMEQEMLKKTSTMGANIVTKYKKNKRIKKK